MADGGGKGRGLLCIQKSEKHCTVFLATFTSVSAVLVEGEVKWIVGGVLLTSFFCCCLKKLLCRGVLDRGRMSAASIVNSPEPSSSWIEGCRLSFFFSFSSSSSSWTIVLKNPVNEGGRMTKMFTIHFRVFLRGKLTTFLYQNSKTISFLCFRKKVLIPKNWVIIASNYFYFLVFGAKRLSEKHRWNIYDFVYPFFELSVWVKSDPAKSGAMKILFCCFARRRRLQI